MLIQLEQIEDISQVVISVNQTNIGTEFVVGDIISQDATEYIKANATDDTKTALGVVVEIVDDDNIKYQIAGRASYTKSTLVKGAQYYLDDTDGNITNVAPDNYSQSLFEAVETDEIIIDIGYMFVIDPSSIEFADLADKDRAEQDEDDLGNKSGSITVDLSYSNTKMTLTGNVTSVTFSNLPASSKRTTFVLNVYQDGTGSRTINWVGSDVRPPLGDTSSELQPNTSASSLTQYWLYWNGADLTITMIQIDDEL